MVWSIAVSFCIVVQFNIQLSAVELLAMMTFAITEADIIVGALTLLHL